MVLVELIRLVIVLSLTAVGYTTGRGLLAAFGMNSSPGTLRLVASILGAGIGYVAGGFGGRIILAGVGLVEKKVDRVSGGELVTGAIGLLVGSVAGVLVAWPTLWLVPIDLIALPVAALAFITCGYLGLRIAARKSFDLLGLMGLSQSRNFVDEKQSLSAGPRVLDTSAIIDGRIVDVARTGFLSGHLVCPAFVLSELRSIADSHDGTRRARGRRGLEVLESLQGEPHVRLEVTDDPIPEAEDVDGKLIVLTKRIEGALVTTDFNLHKTAELQGVPVLNLNSLSAILRPVVLPGETINVRVVRSGTQPHQGVGYLEDGTMVVIEGGQSRIGEEVEAVVTSALQTGAGRMIFTTLELATSRLE
jgi:uncharacterized protein YacL